VQLWWITAIFSGLASRLGWRSNFK